MKLYSKNYAGQNKQLTFPVTDEAEGDRMVTIFIDTEGQVYQVVATEVMLDGYDVPIILEEEASVDGQPAEQFFMYPSGGYSDEYGVIAPGERILAAHVFGARPVMEIVDLPADAAQQLLDNTSFGRFFVPWRDKPKPKRAPRKKKG